jgi:hypothetical protein
MEITAYDFGRIEIAGKHYTSDVIIFPEQVKDHWWRIEGHSLDIADLDEVIAAKPQLLVIGTGYYGRMAVPDETRALLESRGIRVLEARTGEAVEEFNRLQRQYARIIAALHLTC